MSVDAITWGWKQRTGDPTRKAVLLAIADVACPHGHAWPSVAFIADRTETSDKTARRHLNDLVEAGMLRRRRRHRSNGQLGVYDYWLQMPRETWGSEKHCERPECPANEPPVILTAGDSTTGHPRPDHRSPTTGGPPVTHDRADPSVDLDPSVDPSGARTTDRLVERLRRIVEDHKGSRVRTDRLTWHREAVSLIATPSVSLEKIGEVLEWLEGDSDDALWWRGRITSVRDLRAHFDKLEASIASERKRAARSGGSGGYAPYTFLGVVE